MKSFFLLAVLFTAIFSYAQTDIPEFGQFQSSDISLTQCEFDKDAEAVIIFDVANSNYNEEYNLITNHRIRLKILKQKGIEKANIEIPFYSKDAFENISDINAISYTFNNNGQATTKQLDKKTIFRQKLNDRVSLLKFTIPDVKAGTIIDYKYQSTAKDYNGLDDWYFQSDMPTMLSRYDLTIVPNAEFTYIIHKNEGVPIKVSNDQGTGTMHYEMSNIAGLRNEPFMDASKDYLQHVEFQFAGYVSRLGTKVKYMTTWKESAKELNSADYFGRQIDKNLSNSEEIIAKANTFSTPYLKMKFIYEYVQSNLTWNNIDSKYATDGIKSAWSNKKGTSGEINLILINLLRQAGIEVYPMLVSERDHGKVNTDYPILEQFNKAVAYAITGDKKFVLDATSYYTPVNMIPYDILNTNAFIVDNKNPVVITLTNATGATNFINIFSRVDNNGVIDGYATVNSMNYERLKRLEDYKRDKEKFKQDYFEKNYGEIRIDSFEVNNIENDSLAFQQKFKFSIPAAVSGDYKLINVNLFSGLEKNPFTLDDRFSDVDFGCTRQTDVYESFELPPTLKPEELPKNIRLATPDKTISFIRVTTMEENSVIIQMSLKINQTIYTASEYSTLKEFYKKMYNMLSEEIVLSKK